MEKRKISLTMQSWENNHLLVEREGPCEIKNTPLNVPQSLALLLGLKQHADYFHPIGKDLQRYWGLC